MNKQQMETYLQGLIDTLNSGRTEYVTAHGHKLITQTRPLTERNYKRIFAEIQRVQSEVKERSGPSVQPICEAVVGRP